MHNRPQRWRLTVMLASVAAGVAVCAVAAFVVLGSINSGDNDNDVRSGAAANTPLTSAERDVVPNGCDLLNKQLTDRLAPNADQSQSDAFQSDDRQNQCVWGAYTGAQKRQLTVELRAIAGTGGVSATDTARRSFQTERQADESGKGLLGSQRLIAKQPVPNLGEEAYVVYSVDGSQGSGEAVVNVRVNNVLVTIHYSGGNDGSPLADKPAVDGGIEAAKQAVAGLGTNK